jgi:membrane protein YfhO
MGPIASRSGPIVLVATGFALLFAALFAPALLGGRVLAPPGDGLLYYYPMRAHVAHVLRDGHLPLWNPYIYSGFPLLADIEVGAFYPPNVLFLILPAPLAMNLVALSSYVLAALFAFLYARAVGASPFGGLVAGIAFGASGFMLSHLGHASIVNGAAWFPLVMLFAERLRVRATVPAMVGAAATLAVQIFAGHPQVAAYSLLTAGLYLLFFAACGLVPAGRVRAAAASAAALVLGLGLAAAQIVPTAELTSQSNRAWISYEAFSEPLLPLSHLFLFLFPYAFGGGAAGPYALAPTGLSVAEATGYVGLVTLALALAAVPLSRTNPHARFWLGILVLSLVMALGAQTPLHRILFLLPGYNRFRAPARNLMQADLALALLAGLAASHLPALAPALRRTAGLVAAATVALGALVLSTDARSLGLVDARAPLAAAPGALRPPAALAWMAIAFALATAVAVVRLARRDDARARRLVLAVLVADLGVFAQLCYGPFQCPTAAELARPSPLQGVLDVSGGPAAARFLSLTPEERPEDFALNEPDSSVLRSTASAAGNSSFVLGRYGALVGWTDTPGGVDLAGAGGAFDLLGVSRLIVADQLLFPRPRVSVRGIGLADGDLGLKLARRRGNAVEFELPGLRCSALAVEATSLSGELDASVPLVRASVVTADGRRAFAVLRAGREHAPYRMAWDLGGELDIVRVRLEVMARLDALRVDRLVLHDARTGHTLALGAAGEGALARLLPVPHRVEVAIPVATGSALEFVSAISGPTTLPQGQAMARVSVHTAEGGVIERTLRAGVDTSEWAWERPDVRPFIRHRMAPVAETFPAEGGFPGHRYRGRLDLGGPHRVERIVIEHVGPDSSLYVDRVDLVDEAARTAIRLPLEAVELQPAATAPRGPRETTLAVPPLPCTALRVVTALHDSTAVHQGQAVGRVTVRPEDGPAIVALLRAGQETSEWAWDRPDVRPRVKHDRAPVAESFPVAGQSWQGHRYAARIGLDARRRVVEVEVEALAPVASLEVGKIVFEDGDDRAWSMPAEGIPAVLTPEETQARARLDTPAAPATDVFVVSRLSRSLEVGQGQPVAVVRAWTTDGEVIEKALRAGQDTSEWRARRPDAAGAPRHSEAAGSFSAAAGMEPGTWYLGRMPLGGRRRLRSVAIEAVDPAAVLSVARISLYDAATGTSSPVSGMRTLLAERPAWRRLCAAPGATIYENTAALPRAWLVRRVRPVSEADALAAVRGGRLPDGTAFDPRRTALVEDGIEVDHGPLDPQARVDVQGRGPNGLGAVTRSRTPAFLVLADAAYPGWRATVDGKAAPIVRADHVLRGLALAAGEHRVELEYRPRSFVLGVAVSAAALVALAVAGRAARRRAWPALAAVALPGALWLVAATVRPAVSSASRTRRAPHRAPPVGGLVDLAAIPDGASVLGPGWWPAEAWAMDAAGRWTADEAVLRLRRNAGETGLALDMTFDNPSGETAIRLEAGGRTLATYRGPNGRRRDVVDISGVPGRDIDLRIVAERPFASLWRPVGRLQGVFVHAADLLEAPIRSEADLFAAADSAPELAAGWWGAESWAGGPGGRWTTGEAVLRLQRQEDQDGLVVDLSLDHPQGLTTGRIGVDGGPSQVLRAPNGRRTISLPIGGAGGRTVTVRFVADRPFVPRAYDPSSGDGRALGMFVHSARLVPYSRCP